MISLSIKRISESKKDYNAKKKSLCESTQNDFLNFKRDDNYLPCLAS